jgi:hypothetical protein
MLGVVALAQHYGVPTRLLDWTFKPLVAAYFAALNPAKRQSPDPAKHLAVWVLNAAVPLPQLTQFINGKVERLAFVQAPYASNPNLAAQAGLFTLDRLAKTGVGLEETLPPLVQRHLSKRMPAKAREAIIEALGATRGFPVFYKFTLPHAEAGTLLRLLAVEGIHAGTLFPGHRGVVESLVERKYWGAMCVRDLRWQRPSPTRNDPEGPLMRDHEHLHHGRVSPRMNVVRSKVLIVQRQRVRRLRRAPRIPKARASAARGSYATSPAPDDTEQPLLPPWPPPPPASAAGGAVAPASAASFEFPVNPAVPPLPPN